jgi:type 1 glutamine amidotransferase
MFRCVFLSAALFASVFPITTRAQSDQKLKALIVDGQNNHSNWPNTTRMMKKYLEDTGRFTVDVATTADKGTDPNYKPEFQKYNVVVSNYNGAAWPEATQSAFNEYVKGGGGFVCIHAADNAFPEWPAYNTMIGLGGWGGRNEKSGPYVYLDNSGKVVRDEATGGGGHHGPPHPFQIVVRNSEHPITKGMPKEWLHVNDELYDKLRGPGENMHILATTFADPAKLGTGHHEPMIITIDYGKGRVFHTPMGHGNDSQECVGFITTFIRGCEWAATGQVTQPIPSDFPTADKTSQRKFQAAK